MSEVNVNSWKGDVPGHAFHGNQYHGGSGGGSVHAESGGGSSGHGSASSSSSVQKDWTQETNLSKQLDMMKEASAKIHAMPNGPEKIKAFQEHIAKAKAVNEQLKQRLAKAKAANRQTDKVLRKTAPKKSIYENETDDDPDELEEMIAEIETMLEVTMEKKSGRRNSAADADKLKKILALIQDLLASEQSEPDENAMQKSMLMGMAPDSNVAYAVQEMQDISTAAQALIAVSNLQEEAGEPDDIAKVADIMRAIVAFISGEIDEMQSAGESGGENSPAKAISKREDVSPKRGESEYGDVKFADSKNKKYPIDTPEHIRAAWTYINRPADAGKYDPEDVAKIKAAIVAAWKEKIEKSGPPSAEKSFGSYAKSLGLLLPDDMLAVKSIGRDEIRGYSMLWGNPQKTDIEIEYFTRDTDFWDHMGKSVKPLTWDHAQDAEFKASPVIGQISDFGDDDVGRWYVARLDRSHRYRKAVDALIEAGKLGTSSDSAPQYVERVKTGKATWLKTWPFFAAALTDCPAEPRMVGSLEYLKSIGVILPDTDDLWKYQLARMKRAKLNLFK